MYVVRVGIYCYNAIKAYQAVYLNWAYKNEKKTLSLAGFQLTRVQTNYKNNVCFEATENFQQFYRKEKVNDIIFKITHFKNRKEKIKMLPC